MGRIESRLLAIRLLGLGVLLLAMGLSQTAAQAQESPCPQLEEHARAASLREQFLGSRISIRARATDQEGSGDDVDATTWRYWSAMQGSESLSEPDMLELCGLHDFAVRAGQRRSGAERWINVAQTSSTVGLLALVVGLNAIWWTDEDPEWAGPAVYGGAALIGVGLAIGTPAFISRDRSYLTMAEARAAANEYNESLCRSLAEQE